MKKQILLAGAAAGLALTASTAHAQSIDYGSLQELFGESVTTSATGSPQRASQAPVAMEIVTAADIERSGATDIPTILSRTTGVDVLSWAAGGATDVGVRGYNSGYSPRLLVLINGRQVYLDHYGYTAWSALPVALSEIRQIEVVRGPNSALFGFNAVSGVINIITYNPKLDAKSSATVSAGANGFADGSLVASFRPNDQIGVRLSVSAAQEDQWKGVAAVARRGFALDPNRIASNLDTVIQLGPKTELRIEGSWSNVVQNDMLPTYSFAQSKYLTNSLRAQLNSETAYGLLTAGVYQNAATIKYQINTGPLKFDNKITVVQVQDLLKPNARTTVRLGVEYRQNKLNTSPVAGGEVSYDVMAPSVMVNFAATEKLSLTGALRYDRLKLSRTGTFPAAFPYANNKLFDKTISETTGNLGAVFAATPVDSFRLSAAKGAQVPTLLELGGIDLPYKVGPYTIALIGTPDTKPTIVTSYELAYDRDLPALGGKVGVNVFSQKTKDLKGMPDVSALDIAPTATTFPGILFAKNVADSSLTGFELHASGATKQALRWSVNWNQTQIKMSGFPGQNLAARQVLFNQITPQTRINASLGWSDAAWSIDGYARYVSKFRTDAYKGLAGDYVNLSGRLARKFDNGLTASVVVENALQDGKIQDSPAAAERRAFLTLSKTW